MEWVFQARNSLHQPESRGRSEMAHGAGGLAGAHFEGRTPPRPAALTGMAGDGPHAAFGGGAGNHVVGSGGEYGHRVPTKHDERHTWSKAEGGRVVWDSDGSGTKNGGHSWSNGDWPDATTGSGASSRSAGGRVLPPERGSGVGPHTRKSVCAGVGLEKGNKAVPGREGLNRAREKQGGTKPKTGHPGASAVGGRVH